MHQSWSKRHARPTPSTPQTEQKQPQQQPQQQLRRMASFSQRFRGSKPTPAEPSSQEQKDRPRTFYVPTHAAASFAKTVSPLTATFIDERDELSSSTTSTGTGNNRCGINSTQQKGSNYHATVAANTTQANNKAYPSRQAISRKGRESSSSTSTTDYASFLAEAEVNDRAFRTRMAHRRSNSAAGGQTHTFSKPHRDSAYYSTGSRSSVSGSEGRPSRVSCHMAKDTVAPLSAAPASTLAGKPTKTLGRRLSEYFKPPNAEGGVGVMA
ncbi:hypothetical protein QQS21_009941 [Conoideocrella luteorostrata]|uniref:Uncharacterized protein n=1 Tax=Conoideocrella luteorostrata TaxID=1105319 RepID=A0AAJ0FPV9_9HYPO|nr:hypothetical protein QQS21_009941 [Conoideocrella luteorostrata]